MDQQFSSKKTSINSRKLPAIYNKIDWSKLNGKILLDFGCGKYYNIIREYLERFNIKYIPYDKYWDVGNYDEIETMLKNQQIDIIVSSNVFNVIKEDEIISSILTNLLCNDIKNTPYVFLKIYEGNKSNFGCKSMNDSWQRNQKLKVFYNEFFNSDFAKKEFYDYNFIIFKNTIISNKSKQFFY